MNQEVIHLKRTHHSQHLCRYHIVFIPKWRKAFLPAYEAVLLQLIPQRLALLGAAVLELSIQEDHIHLFIEARPDRMMSTLIGKLKSGLSSFLFDTYPELKDSFRTGSIWARGYFICTCGVDEAIIRSYIRNQ